FDRRHGTVHLFERDTEHGSGRVGVRIVTAPLGSDELRALLGDETSERLTHDIHLLDAAGHPYDEAAVLAGELSPTFFGSALTNFGVEPFLHAFLSIAPAPVARESSVGPIVPTDPDFTAFVFKIQANMDPRHRD